jgi:two-component system CheB/CheR fusion protein
MEFHGPSEHAVAELEAMGRTTPYEKEYFRKDGSRWWGLFAARQISDDEVVEFVLDVSDRRGKEQALAVSEERLRLIIESARDYAIFTTDADGIINGWYGGAENVFGWCASEAVGQDVAMTFTAEDRETNQPEEERRTTRIDGRAVNVRWHCRNDGTLVFIEGFVVPLRADSGEVTGFLKIGQDVTDRMKAREHERMLMAELQHRVRNTLAVVRSITRRTASSSDSVEEMSDHLQGRLAAFSRVQAAVTRDPSRGIDLTHLIEDELLAYAAHEGSKVRIEGVDVNLEPRAAETISLALHELTTNAVKYGALLSELGRIEIRWTMEGQDGSERLRFTWSERHITPPTGELRQGFGTELLLRSLPYELDAVTRLDFGAEDMTFELVMPTDKTVRS